MPRRIQALITTKAFLHYFQINLFEIVRCYPCFVQTLSIIKRGCMCLCYCKYAQACADIPVYTYTHEHRCVCIYLVVGGTVFGSCDCMNIETADQLAYSDHVLQCSVWSYVFEPYLFTGFLIFTKSRTKFSSNRE